MTKYLHFRIILLFFVLISVKVSAQEDPPVNVDTIPAYVKQYDKALLLIDSAKYEAAIPILKKITKENPDYYMAHNKMAFIFIQQKKYKEADKSLDKAEKIRPLNFDSQKLRSINYFLTNRFAECKAAIDSALGIAMDEDKDDPELLYYQAKLMFKGKSYKQALLSCQTALDLSPRYVEVMILKAEIRIAMKDHLNAVLELNDAIKIIPPEKPDLNCHKMRAKSNFEIKDFKGAISDWTVLLDADPKNEEALISRASAKINIGENSSAIADLDAAIKINSKNPVSYCNRGLAKSGNKSYVEAIKDLDYAIKLKFDYADAYFRRAGVKFKSKDKHGACEDLAKADSLGDPDAFRFFDQFCKSK